MSAKTKREVLLKLRSLQQHADAGVLVPDQRVTVSVMLDVWLDDVLPGTVSAVTEGFEPLVADYTLFTAVRVNPDAGTIVWPNGADLSPSGLYTASKPAIPA